MHPNTATTDERMFLHYVRYITAIKEIRFHTSPLRFPCSKRERTPSSCLVVKRALPPIAMRICDRILLIHLVITVFRSLLGCRAAIIFSATIVHRRTKTRRCTNRVILVILGICCAAPSRTPLGFTICHAGLSIAVLPLEKNGVQVLLFAVYPVRRRVEQAAERRVGDGGVGGGSAGRRLLSRRARLGLRLGRGPLGLHFGGRTDGRRGGAAAED